MNGNSVAPDLSQLRQQLAWLQRLAPVNATTRTQSSIAPQDKPIQLTGDLRMENNINVYLKDSKDKQLGVDIEGAVLDSLDNVFKLVKQRLND